jgi:hypothetical protein
MWAKIIAALHVAWLVVVVAIGVHLSRRLGRVERWNADHGPPLERLDLEQQAGDPARTLAVRRPHHSGSSNAPH